MTKYISEMLKEINEDPKNVAKYKDSAALKILFGFAYRPEGKMLLPDGDPPFKPDAAPIGMNPTNLLSEIKKLYVFVRKDISKVRREQLFIQLLESVHPDEANVLLAVKDQDLSKVYKKITHKFAYENGFVPNPPPEKKAKKDGASTRTAS
jgi:hypothetical protein